MLNLLLHRFVTLKSNYYISISIVLLLVIMTVLFFFPYPSESEPLTLYSVSVNKANLRQAPNSSAKIIAVIKKNNLLKLLSKQDQWLHFEVLPAGKLGWMHASIVAEENQAATAQSFPYTINTEKRGTKRTKIAPIPPMTDYNSRMEFKKFKASYDALLKFSLPDSLKLFTKIKPLPGNTLYVETSEQWSVLDHPQQNNHLDTTYNIWLAAISGDPGLIFLYDSKGEFIRSYPSDRGSQDNL